MFTAIVNSISNLATRYPYILIISMLDPGGGC